MTLIAHTPWNEPPFTDADLEHHRRWLDEHGQKPNPDECAVCCAIAYRGAVEALEAIRDRLEPLVNDGEPCETDAEDVYEMVTTALARLGGR